MNKSGLKLFSRIFIIIMVLTLLRCKKTDPCDELSPMQRFVLCRAEQPADGAIVSPVKVQLQWISKGTNKIYFGTDKNNLSLISTQSEHRYILTDLESDTRYYWRVEAKTRCTGCGTATRSFTTIPDNSLPLVLTAPVYTHKYSPPRVGGNILSEGSSAISESGIYYGTSTNPEKTGSKFQINTGKGLFSDLLLQLSPSTKYYIKAYATNKSGTAYGVDTSFVTDQNTGYNSIIDIDGNSYYVIKIGDQTWMAENLRTTRFNDGTPIPNILDINNSGNTNTPVYGWYDNIPGIKTTYGALYNGFTIDPATNGNRNVCPVGWHIPNDSEWSVLIGFLGGGSVASARLKESGDYYWIYQAGAHIDDNSSDFSALPGGVAYFESSTGAEFSSVGQSAEFWSSGEFHTLYLDSSPVSIMMPATGKKSGHSIRCVEN